MAGDGLGITSGLTGPDRVSLNICKLRNRLAQLEARKTEKTGWAAKLPQAHSAQRPSASGHVLYAKTGISHRRLQLLRRGVGFIVLNIGKAGV